MAFAVLVVAAGAAASGRSTVVRSPGPRLAVGYAGRASLVRATRATHATIVRTLTPLHVAEVRGNAETLRRQPGIRYVQPVHGRLRAPPSPR